MFVVRHYTARHVYVAAQGPFETLTQAQEVRDGMDNLGIDPGYTYSVEEVTPQQWAQEGQALYEKGIAETNARYARGDTPESKGEYL